MTNTSNQISAFTGGSQTLDKTNRVDKTDRLEGIFYLAVGVLAFVVKLIFPLSLNLEVLIPTLAMAIIGFGAGRLRRSHRR